MSDVTTPLNDVAPMSYIDLRSHSNFSFLEGVSHIEEPVRRFELRWQDEG